LNRLGTQAANIRIIDGNRQHFLVCSPGPEDLLLLTADIAIVFQVYDQIFPNVIRVLGKPFFGELAMRFIRALEPLDEVNLLKECLYSKLFDFSKLR
jgi:hypothetical protein